VHLFQKVFHGEHSNTSHTSRVASQETENSARIGLSVSLGRVILRMIHVEGWVALFHDRWFLKSSCLLLVGYEKAGKYMARKGTDLEGEER